MNNGSCLCGDISWEVDGQPLLISNCHCSMCRKTHGSAFATHLHFPAHVFRWTSGEANVGNYRSPRGGDFPFCPRCGSQVAAPMEGAESVGMPAGNVEGEIDRRLDRHIFVGSKAVWYDITDDATQFEAYPAGIDAPGADNPERLPATAGSIGGSCLCGAVAFEFDETLGRMGFCHCSRCRKSRSSAHSAQTFIAPEKFRWLRGEDELRTYKLPESQLFCTAFCATCASLMPVIHADQGIVMVPAGALDQDPGVRPQAHIYVGSKAPWFEITDALPQFETMPGTLL